MPQARSQPRGYRRDPLGSTTPEGQMVGNGENVTLVGRRFCATRANGRRRVGLATVTAVERCHGQGGRGRGLLRRVRVVGHTMESDSLRENDGNENAWLPRGKSWANPKKKPNFAVQSQFCRTEPGTKNF